MLCLDSARLDEIAARPELRPVRVTADARARRVRYLQDAERGREEAAFSGSNAEFLGTLALVLTIRPAREADLARAEELIARTNQLNATWAEPSASPSCAALCAATSTVCSWPGR